MRRFTLLIIAFLAVHYAAFADYAMGPAAVSISVNGNNSVYYALPIQDWGYSYYITWDDPNPTAWSGYLAMNPLPSPLPSGFGTVTSLSLNKAMHVFWTNDNTVVEYLQYRVYPDTEDADALNLPYIIGATLDASTIVLGSSTADQKREANANINLLSSASEPGGYYVEIKLSYAEHGQTVPSVYVPGSWVRLHFTVPSSTPPAQYPVALKVIDQSKGTITNDVDNNNETNIICWIDGNLVNQNPRSPNDWWYPMYNDSGVTPTGQLIKGNKDWTWEITLNASAGTYTWNPEAKSLWKPINPDMFAYTGDDKDNNLIFTVNADGTISGHTELVIPNLTGIPGIGGNNAVVTGEKSSLSATFEGTAEVAVYSMQGTLVQKATAQNTFKSGNLPAGVYLVKIGNKTYKTVVK